jgi:hypothetical protein
MIYRYKLMCEFWRFCGEWTVHYFLDNQLTKKDSLKTFNIMTKL